MLSPSLSLNHLCSKEHLLHHLYRCYAGRQTSWQIASLPAAEAIAQLCSRKMTALQYAEAVTEIAETYSCLNAFSFLDKDKVAVPPKFLPAQH